jgi:hypothetical protein
MSLEGERPKPWRLALLVLVGAYVGVVGYLALRNESDDETPLAKLRVVQAPSASSGTQAPARIIVGAAAPIFKINAAVQKPGPPNPAAERSAADAAEKAADAAAAIAASVATGTN